jgi:ADP-heptose:LPS heptosyltransferase
MPIKDRHILICRTDNIGDVVLTLPITAFIKKLDPTVKISFLCRAYSAPLVRLCKTVDEVIEADTVPDLVETLHAAKIDAVIFAQPDRDIAAAALAAGIPKRIGNIDAHLYQLYYCNKWLKFSAGRSRRHEAQLNFKFLEPIGVKVMPERVAISPLFQFDVPRDEEVKRILDRHTFNLIFHPKSNGNGREWPATHYLELARQLARDHPNAHILLTGSAAEGKWLEENAPQLIEQGNASNLCGQLSLEKFASLIRFSDGLIASGTGPLHVSAAFGQNTVGLFPPIRGKNPTRWAALGPRSHSLCEISTCISCLDRRNHRQMSCDCMKSIQPEAVKEIVSRWVHEKSGRALITSGQLSSA